MSPEQILGLAVGSRADIFATGVILYQFLTGRRPFTGGGPFGVQRKIVQDDDNARAFVGAPPQPIERIELMCRIGLGAPSAGQGDTDRKTPASAVLSALI